MYEERPYQNEAVDRVVKDLWGSGLSSSLLVMATGTGKTHVFAKLAKRLLTADNEFLPPKRDRKILVIAHRDRLIEQLENKLREACVDIGLDPWSVGREQGKCQARRYMNIVVSTPVTMRNRIEKRKFKASDFCLVVTDEAHMGRAPSYMAMYDYFRSGAKLLGLTATPFRSDDKSLGAIYENVSFEYDIFQATREGYLCPIVGPGIVNNTVDFSNCSLTSRRADGFKEYKMREVSDRIRDSRLIEKSLDDLCTRASGRQTIVFNSSVEQADMTAKLLQSMGVSAESVSSKKRPEENREAYERYEQGDIQFITNMDMMTVGVDFPKTACLAFLRPTKSHVLWWQMLGRLTRKHESKKNGLLLDYVGVSDKHDVAAVNAFSLLWPWMDKEDLKLASKLSDGKMDMHEIKDEVWKAKNNGKPRMIGNYLSDVEKRKKDVKDQLVSDLNELGVGKDKARKMDPESAKRMLKSLRKRKEEGLATYAQCIQLRRYGLASMTATITSQEATKVLLKIKKNGQWPKPSEVSSLTCSIAESYRRSQSAVTTQ